MLCRAVYKLLLTLSPPSRSLSRWHRRAAFHSPLPTAYLSAREASIFARPSAKRRPSSNRLRHCQIFFAASPPRSVKRSAPIASQSSWKAVKDLSANILALALLGQTAKLIFPPAIHWSTG